MIIDMKLFAILAFAVIIVGGFLWFKPRSGKKSNSGIGDQGQLKK